MLLALLPQLHESIADNVKPSYRSWAAGWTGEVPMADYMLFLSELTDMVLAVAESDQTRWPELLEHIFCLQETDFAKVIDGLERLTSQSIAEELRLALWEQLREQVQAHSYFHDARWARSKAEVAKLASLRDKLAPTDLATTAAYLFDDDGGRDGDRTETYEQKRERRANERRPAIRAIWNTQGVSAVLELARKVRQPWSVGWSLAQELGAEAQPVVVPGLLSSEEMPVLQCARAFALQRIQAKGLDWAEAEPAADWKFEQVAEWALQMPFQKRTWNWLIPKGEAAERNYWKKTTLWDIAQLDIEAIERAAQKLQEVGRPWSALQLLVRALLDKKPLRSALLCDALEASSKTSTGQARHHRRLRCPGGLCLLTKKPGCRRRAGCSAGVCVFATP